VTKLSRRSFLTRATAVLFVLVAAPYAFYHIKYGKAANVVIAILKRRVGYLKTEPGSFDRFAEDYVHYKRAHARQLSKLSVAAFPLTYVTLYRLLPMGHPLRRLEDNVVTKYLLSTDFFFHDADESREVKYLSFYEPSVTPCRNPFASLRKPR
jgi:hypothetical protein